MQDAVIGSVVVLVMALPFMSQAVERNLEVFLFIMGAIAVTASTGWSWHLIEEALREPIPISVTVLIGGLLFERTRHRLDKLVDSLRKRIRLPQLLFSLVALLGFLSSVVSAIVASLLLVEVISRLRLKRKAEVRLAVLGCYAIGFGAILTPIGEPLSAIVTSKLHAHFWYLARTFAVYAIPAVLGIALIAALSCAKGGGQARRLEAETSPRAETYWRAARVFMFVAALLLLGSAIMPMAAKYLVPLSPSLLYWANILSAVLDNATLAAAEISPKL